MKKFVKMSLVAAVAVAGLTTANAKPLEEAIKGVDVSGTLVYRYNEVSDDKNTANSSTAANYYKAAINFKAPVNDNITANTSFVVGTPAANGGAAGANGDYGFATLDTTANGDQSVDVVLSKVNFAVTAGPATIIAGKQGLNTPWTVASDSDGNEQTGTGAVALVNAGPVTVAAAYFNQTNLDDSGNTKFGNGSEDISAVAIIAPVAGFTIDAWYLDAANTFDTYTVGVKGSVDAGAKIGIDARYVSLKMDAAGSKTNSLTKATVTADMGLIDAKVAVGFTGKDGGTVTLDTDSATGLQSWYVNTTGKADATFVNAVVGVDAMPGLNISANYANVDYKVGAVDTEEEELYAQAMYKMGKNFYTYVRYGNKTTTSASTKTYDATHGRLQVQYTF